MLEPELQHKVKILIVDDREDNLLALETLLANLKQEVIRANSGQEALKHVLKNDFAVILLDVMMPGMDGFETAELIRQREKSQFIPIIFLTAIAREQQFVFKGYSSGAVDYIYKPLVPEILLAKVKIFIDLYLKNEIMLEQERELKRVNIQLTNEISERKRIEELKTLAMVASKSYNAISISDKDGKIEWVNEGFTLLTGYEPEELVGTMGEVVRRDGSRYMEFVDLVKFKKEPISYEEKHLTKKGREFYVLVTLTPVFDDNGQLDKILTIGSDITEHKRYEQKLQEANNKAEAAVKAKQQFLSNMSHEIRTPMNAIIGFTKIALKTELSPKQYEYISAIKASGDALIVLINDILDLAKVDAGKMTFEQIPFKPAASISAILHLFESRIIEKNLKLVSRYDDSIPEVLIGDPVRLHQIILNLISNAVKFTESGKITIDVKLQEEKEDQVNIKFSVTDTGIGIEESELDSIFENFQQANNETTRKYGGTGLGLAISKQLVESQNGKFSVVSKPNQGSTFSFFLNFYKTDETIPGEEPFEISTEPKSIKVLVVEDVALNQLLMKAVLNEFGFEYELAENGKVAIENLENKQFDIILMDLQMPEMDGFSATRYIRETMNLSIPIIALTADVTTSSLEKCQMAGMNDYIAKPLNEKLLYTKIINLVSAKAV